MDRKVIIDNISLDLSNLEKIFFPELKITKAELIAYYESIADFILPHLKDRPQSLNRFPNGIYADNFFQKNIDSSPPWLKIFEDDSGSKKIDYAICNDKGTLIYLINLGCIDINVWNSKISNPEKPDFMVFDLDPVEIDFKYILEAALEINKLLKSLGINSYPKTSGKRGLHIYIPLIPVYSYEQVKNFALLLMLKINKKLPQTTSLERLPENRVGKVYLDYLQNRKGATMAAPYSVRPVKSASVSTPVTWEEIERGFKPEDFTIKNVPARLKKIGDIFTPTLKSGIRIEDYLDQLD